MIQLINVSKNYSNKEEQVSVLRNVHLEIQKGEKVSLMGKNGSGKTTLLNILSTVDIPDGGEYIFNGKKMPIDEFFKLNKIRRSHFGYIPQKSCLIKDKSGRHNIELPLLFRGYSKEKIEYEVTLISEQMEIESLMNKKAGKMSAGERQKISIARALVTHPEVIFADEVTNTLDEDSKIKVLDLIKKNTEMTAIIVTHDVQVANYFDRLLYLDNGFIKNTTRCHP